MAFKTRKQWADEGYFVIDGKFSRKKDSAGESLFADDQVISAPELSHEKELPKWIAWIHCIPWGMVLLSCVLGAVFTYFSDDWSQFLWFLGIPVGVGVSAVILVFTDVWLCNRLGLYKKWSRVIRGWVARVGFAIWVIFWSWLIIGGVLHSCSGSADDGDRYVPRGSIR